MASDASFDFSIKSLIDSIDLNTIFERMVKVNNWSPNEALEGLKQYKNFLFLKKKYGEKYMIPPSLDIDEFWHNHILHTKKYFDDCNIIFGSYLHHHPNHGENRKLSDETLKKIFEEETQRLHFNEFGTYLYAIRPIPYKITAKKIIKQLNFLTFLRRM